MREKASKGYAGPNTFLFETLEEAHSEARRLWAAYADTKRQYVAKYNAKFDYAWIEIYTLNHSIGRTHMYWMGTVEKGQCVARVPSKKIKLRTPTGQFRKKPEPRIYV
jgi:hypothetical protein